MLHLSQVAIPSGSFLKGPQNGPLWHFVWAPCGSRAITWIGRVWGVSLILFTSLQLFSIPALVRSFICKRVDILAHALSLSYTEFAPLASSLLCRERWRLMEEFLQGEPQGYFGSRNNKQRQIATEKGEQKRMQGDRKSMRGTSWPFSAPAAANFSRTC